MPGLWVPGAKRSVPQHVHVGSAALLLAVAAICSGRVTKADDAFMPLSAHRDGQRAVPIAERTAEERGPSKLLRWKQYRPLAMRQESLDRLTTERGRIERTSAETAVSDQAIPETAPDDSAAEPALIPAQAATPKHISSSKRVRRKTASSRSTLRSAILQVSATEGDDPFQNPFGEGSAKKTEKTAQLEQPNTGGTFDLEESPETPTEQQAPAEAPMTTEPAPLDPSSTPAPAVPDAGPDGAAKPLEEALSSPSPSDATSANGDAATANTDADAAACETEKSECAKALRTLQANALARISLDLRVNGTEGTDFPCECAFGNEQFPGRAWGPTCYTWKASGLCHKPLYFEEVALERYGHSMTPLVQDVVSGAHFFATIPALPYAMALCPPDECQYALGYYRPGDCAPYLVDPIPLNLRAASVQAGVVAAAIILIP